MSNSYLELGFDKLLQRGGVPTPNIAFPVAGDGSPLSLGADSGSSIQNPVTQAVQPTQIQAGSLEPILFSQKTSFTDTQAGYRMGLDKDGVYKWIIGGPTSSADWSVTTLNTFTINGTIVASAGSIGGWTINTTTLSSSATAATSGILLDAGNQQIRVGSGAGNNILLDGPNLRIRSSNYSAGVAGFTVEPTLIEAENLVARGTMRGVTFKYDVISAVGGQLVVANSDALASDTTALDASTFTVRGDSTFAVNDILHVRAVTASGIQEEYVRVTNVASAPTYTVTRDLAAAFAANSNPVWKAGTAIVKEGTSDGGASYSGGWLRLLGEGTHAPHYSVFARSGVAYNASTEVVRLGNLNGIGSFVADTYGLFVGDGTTTNSLTYDTVSGFLVLNGSIITNQDIFGDGSDGDVTISANTTLSTDMFYNNLTINTGVTLNTGGFRIFVKGTLTLVGTATIARNGTSGGAGTNASGITAGSAGSAGAALADGSLKGSFAGPAGKNGVNGVNAGGGGVSGNPGIAGAAGSNTTKSLVGDGVDGKAGGDGGQSRTDGNGGAGGAAGAKGTTSGTIFNKVRNSIAAYQLFDVMPGGTLAQFNTAAQNGGSGSGGSGGSQTSAGVPGRSGGTGGSGGGGGNAAIVSIFARIITQSGVGTPTISANGGAGGAAGTTAASVDNNPSNQGTSGGSGGSSGGPGGCGGVVILIYSSKTFTGNIQANGGAGGAGAAAGARTSDGNSDNGVAGSNGTTGNAGVVIQLQV